MKMTGLLFKKQRLKCVLSSIVSLLTCHGVFNLLFDVALGKEKLNCWAYYKSMHHKSYVHMGPRISSRHATACTAAHTHVSLSHRLSALKSTSSKTKELRILWQPMHRSQAHEASLVLAKRNWRSWKSYWEAVREIMLRWVSKIREWGRLEHAYFHYPSCLMLGTLVSWLTELPRNQDSQGLCQLCGLHSLASPRNSGSLVPTTDEPYSPQCFWGEAQNKNGYFLQGTFSFHPSSIHLVQEFLLGLALGANIEIKRKTLLTFPSWVTLAQGLVGDWTLGERGNRNTDIQNASRLVPFVELAKPDVMSIWLCVYISYTHLGTLYTQLVHTYMLSGVCLMSMSLISQHCWDEPWFPGSLARVVTRLFPYWTFQWLPISPTLSGSMFWAISIQ